MSFKAFTLTLALLLVSRAMSLSELWSYNSAGTATSLTFSENGNLGVSSLDSCAYVFDQNGNLLNKTCGCWNCYMGDVSYCCGKFGFINEDNKAYIFYENGTLWKKVDVGSHYYHSAITIHSNGFIACRSYCAYLYFNGTRKWNVYVGYVENGPSIHANYVYAADINGKSLCVLRLSNGAKVKEISYNEFVYDTATCSNYLAVSTLHHLYLYDLSDPVNPIELWSSEGLNYAIHITFSPDCRYIAVADYNNKKLKIFDIRGELVLEKGYPNEVYSVAWWNDRIAVGLNSNEFRVYKIVFDQIQNTATTISTSTESESTQASESVDETGTQIPLVALAVPVIITLGRKLKLL
ncbi:hypothetical protein EYM_06575 [Ignicoccus islandicus DSM 13165]|uniref:Anaphase-promoting complex subunit 4 WD40 domain-containing protein n=2 Tax=Ignicoccus islandicus TaxID=54259 RepID=A0A0U2WLZ2_9CREN|nr:hypothetical protein EYM_06575 [Ignicoccus islandicus DSM 13165]